MNLPEVLERLYRWVLVNGIAHRSLAELATSLDMTRGAFCHYFNAGEGGLKRDICRQLILFARELRSRYLVYPTMSFRGSAQQRRTFFVHQMAYYLEKCYHKVSVDSWSCPCFLIENEVSKILQNNTVDEAYLQLLQELWGKDSGFRELVPNVEQVERLLSGPYRPSRTGVLDSFNKRYRKRD